MMKLKSEAIAPTPKTRLMVIYCFAMKMQQIPLYE